MGSLGLQGRILLKAMSEAGSKIPVGLAGDAHHLHRYRTPLAQQNAACTYTTRNETISAVAQPLLAAVWSAIA